MNLRQLECLVRVIECRSMTRAAEALHVAQPALGAQIKLLEQELGVPLLLRHSRGVSATEAGRLLHSHAVSILRAVQEARREVMLLGGKAAEPLRFGMTPSLMQIIGPGLAEQAVATVPEAPLSLSEDMSHRLAGSLRRNDVDMILAYETPAEPGFWKRPLYCEDLVFVTAEGGRSFVPIAFDEVLTHPLILPGPDDSVRALVERTATGRSARVVVRQEIRSIAGIKALIQGGAGAGILPYGTVLAEWRDGRLSCRPIVDPALRRILYLAGNETAGRSPGFAKLLLVVDDAIEALAGAMAPLGERLPREPDLAI
jgi:LysR family nitrogen assimilation transcriptional regulator